jgi:hypothetical protein
MLNPRPSFLVMVLRGKSLFGRSMSACLTCGDVSLWAPLETECSFGVAVVSAMDMCLVPIDNTDWQPMRMSFPSPVGFPILHVIATQFLRLAFPLGCFADPLHMYVFS